ncbi:hypothetical protein EDD18DRAFT_1113949 [Armillaria luteobubalina]|uniref:Uncharacterized protein n=1 Tax=Armillaria luteobubalina TaxID=153913 RepID=A0AA39UEA5_9AGAR|nr:hypothetical protein EDD18DRAFT_1113949 [Armillaria luteobubalina]
MSSVASTFSPSTSSAQGDCKDRVLHLIAMLFTELDDIAPGIIPPGATLSVPTEPLPLPDDNKEASPPTFACGSSFIHQQMKAYCERTWSSVEEWLKIGQIHKNKGDVDDADLLGEESELHMTAILGSEQN